MTAYIKRVFCPTILSAMVELNGNACTVSLLKMNRWPCSLVPQIVFLHKHFNRKSLSCYPSEKKSHGWSGEEAKEKTVKHEWQ